MNVKFFHRPVATLVVLFLTWLTATGTSWGQALQLENNYRNVFSIQGPPTPPPGSPAPTAGQFQNGTAFGGWITTLIPNPGGGSPLAGSPNLDSGGSLIPGPAGTVVNPSGGGYQLTSVRFARPIVMRPPTQLLGSVVARPDRKPDGDPTLDSNFYLAEPWNSIAGNSNANDPRRINGNPVAAGRFYWSPHAQKVFATEPGPVTIIWKLTNPVNTGDPDAPENFFTQRIVVSGSPARPARRIYWNTRDFNGPLVNVPENRIKDANVIYTTAFPKEVPVGQDYRTLNDPPVDPAVALPPERRTLWLDNNALNAYNREGRVFVELLGTPQVLDPDVQEHLGFEIVDVVKEVRPAEVSTNIGEQVYPVQNLPLSNQDSRLVPEIVAGGTDPEYLYRHSILGQTKQELYAVRETTPLQIFDRNNDGVIDQADEQQSNEVLIYWMEEGLMQIKWPKRYVGYIFKWPEDFLLGENPTEEQLRAHYSIYARPEIAGDAIATGVQLDAANNPVLQYQDDSTARHAKLSDQKVFHTVPGLGKRTLIRYTDGEQIWFERVYSIPNQNFEGYATPTSATVASRIEPPAGLDAAVGYIRPTTGIGYNANAYVDPFLRGFEEAAKGAIIPVNAIAGLENLEVWWYETTTPPAGTTFTPTRWPSRVMKYSVTWPAENDDNQIVLARNDGSGELGIAATGSIYRQPDKTLPGYNPNEEHALMSNGVAWALRDDLNLATSSGPYVLIDYLAADGRPAMVSRKVVRETTGHTFNYEAPVGVVLQAPMPLPILPLPLQANGQVKNAEVSGSPTDPSPTTTLGETYNKFTFNDRKGTTWIYRGPHSRDVNVGSVSDSSKNFKMHYYYKTQNDFDFPGLVSNPAEGTIVPYLRAKTANEFVGGAATGTPLEISFTPVWPTNAPVLNIAETLGLPKRGLPAVRGQLSAQVLYEQSRAIDNTRSAKLFDPTRAKTYPLSSTGLKEIPSSIATSLYQGKTYFPSLPPHLSQRLFFDPNVGALGSLVFIGEFVDAPLGEDFFLLNVMSPEDVVAAKGLTGTSDAMWNTAIDELATTLETFKEDPNKLGTYIVDSTATKKVSELAEIDSDNIAVDSYALSAVGGGTGYVVLATGNGQAFTPDATPISLEVFKVAAPLNRGELKVVQSANPLDEKLHLRHSGDFAGDPNDYEFAWLTALPVAGSAPAVYSFTALDVLPNGPSRTWKQLRNPTASVLKDARSFSYNESAWTEIGSLTGNQIIIKEQTDITTPPSVLRDTFQWSPDVPIDLYLSLTLADNDGAIVYLNDAQVAVWNVPGQENSIATTAPGTLSGNTLPLVFAIAPTTLQKNNVVTVQLHTSSDAGSFSSFDLRLDSQMESDVTGTSWQTLTSTNGESGKVSHTISGASISTLADNYFTLRYRAKAGSQAALATGGSATQGGDWSRWMSPQLAEGWIKRALAGINPFQQRVTDLFNNQVNTDVSVLTQAGKRWEGNIALNLENIDDFGLIEIYETILRRGKSLSIDGAPALNVPAANDALLLAAGYLNDLYTLVGNEAFADAANPTIAYSTSGEFFRQFGDVSTSLFAFEGQLSSVLEEELALLRGRDDRLQPGVNVAPVYNRMIWNFTRGVSSGEAVYALNYNIKDGNSDGAADATDAARQFPQGHGDAYGHYLTALKVYYGLFNNENFAWTPRIEAVSVLGQPVSVDYRDERKFAAAAAALTRTASQTLDLTYRQQFIANPEGGWSHLRDGEVNSSTGATRHWGTDEWATRAGQGSYFHWVTANSVLPETDSVNEGIAKVDRTTVPELEEVVSQAEAIQTTLDNADARQNPLGLASGALSFDISPNEISEGKTHYEQIHERALATLKNASFAFDNAKDSTRLLRRQEDSIDERNHTIQVQETTYEKELIEIYGTPYPDDIGPGKTYVQGYNGPDLLHYAYLDLPERRTDSGNNSATNTAPAAHDPTKNYEIEFKINSQGKKLVTRNRLTANEPGDGEDFSEEQIIVNNTDSIKYTLDSEGRVVKPSSFTGRRSQPGELQTAFSSLLNARTEVLHAFDDYATLQADLVSLLKLYQQAIRVNNLEEPLRKRQERELALAKAGLISAAIAKEAADQSLDTIKRTADAISEGLPKVVGLSNDISAPARGTIKFGLTIAGSVAPTAFAIAAEGLTAGLESELRILEEKLENAVAAYEWDVEHAQLVYELELALHQFGGIFFDIDARLREYEQASRDVSTLIAKGARLQKERETFRRRAAALIQGDRTRDIAFRVFRDEALEKYKTLFNLAARYTFLAARAYDYETALLDNSGNSTAAKFFEGIVESRSLGVLDSSGKPQFSSSANGDPGLAGILSQLEGDWTVAKTRLGFNNPDNYRTNFSLRSENFRIIPGENGDQSWANKLAEYRLDNLLADPDVSRHAMQLDDGTGLPVPGLVIPFETTITDGKNFFGKPLLGGDSTFSPTSFATKIRASGIGFKGYIGMDDPTSTGGAIVGAGGQTPVDPDLGFLDPEALSATPYVYLIPVGVDFMRSPPLGDSHVVRSWTVDDQAIPLPYNIGNTNFSTNTNFVSSDSLSEDPFQIRKHQAFRAVPSGTVYSSTPGFTNSRLIGRSAWNSKWKLVIPGKTLRANPDVGLQIFMKNVKDIELFLETYSYSGN